MDRSTDLSPLQTFGQNAADFTKKNGMKIASSIFLLSNIALLAEPLWAPENYNFIRNTAAAGCQIFANAYHFKGKRDKAYDCSTLGAIGHMTASLQQGLYYGACTWGVMLEAAYRGSNWPQRIQKFKHGIFGTKVKDVKEKVSPKKNIISEFIENKVDLLKDPHARTGVFAFIANTGQLIETVLNKSPAHDPTLPWWVAGAWTIAAGFYAAHGLLTARDKKRNLVAA